MTKKQKRIGSSDTLLFVWGEELYIFFPSFAFFIPKKWENPLLPAYSVLRGFLLRRRVETRRTRTENRNEEFCWFLLFPISPPLTAHFSKNSPITFYGIQNRREMDGGENPQAKTEPKERKF